MNEPKEFTGRHMLFVMLGFFGVIITVNITMAVLANRSWTGLVVGNTYVASQQFNERTERGKEQMALGWEPVLSVEPGRLAYSITDVNGSPINLDGVTMLVHRPVSAAADTEIVLERSVDGSYAADVTLDDGSWIVEVEAEAGLEFPYRDVRRILVSEGAMR